MDKRNMAEEFEELAEGLVQTWNESDCEGSAGLVIRIVDALELAFDSGRTAERVGDTMDSLVGFCGSCSKFTTEDMYGDGFCEEWNGSRHCGDYSCRRFEPNGQSPEVH